MQWSQAHCAAFIRPQRTIRSQPDDHVAMLRLIPAHLLMSAVSLVEWSRAADELIRTLRPFDSNATIAIAPPTVHTARAEPCRPSRALSGNRAERGDGSDGGCASAASPVQVANSNRHAVADTSNSDDQ